jgi:hypothetical protein
MELYIGINKRLNYEFCSQGLSVKDVQFISGQPPFLLLFQISKKVQMMTISGVTRPHMDDITNTSIQKMTVSLNLYVFWDVHGIPINERNIRFIVFEFAKWPFFA